MKLADKTINPLQKRKSNPIEIHVQRQLTNPFDDLTFNVIGAIVPAFTFVKNVKSAIETIISWFNPSFKEDKLLKELKKNTEYMDLIKKSIEDINSKINNAIATAGKTGENLDKIKKAQTQQLEILSEVDTRLDSLTSATVNAFQLISRGVSLLTEQSNAIDERIQNVLLGLVNIHKQLLDTKHKVDINTTALQLSHSYQFLFYARERFALLSEGVFTTENSGNEFPDELTAFAQKMAEKSSEGILYNTSSLLNELDGHNFSQTKAAEGLIDNLSYQFNNLPAPLPVSKISYCIAAFTPVIYLIADSLALAANCQLIINKSLSNLTNTIENRLNVSGFDFFTYLNNSLDNQSIENPTILSSLYSTSWKSIPTTSALDPSPQTLSFSVDSGKVITGVEFYIEEDKYYLKVYQAKVGKYYTVDEGDDGKGISEIVHDLTPIFMGLDTSPDPSLYNSEKWNPTKGHNKNLRFNDDYLLTRIDIILKDTYEYDYNVYASKYDALTGSLASEKVEATSSNSTNVTEAIRNIGNDFYQNGQSKTPGFPACKLVDGHLTPLRGFYFYFQGDDFQNDPVIFMTDTFIDKQLSYYIESQNTQSDLRLKSKKQCRIESMNNKSA